MNRPWSRGIVRVRIAALGLTFTLAGCSEQDIRAYRAPKDPAVAAQPAAAAELPAADAGAPALLWRAPVAWRPKAGDAVRRASYEAGAGDLAAEVAITVFPGDAGGILPNVNRWRGQAGLAAVGAAGLAGAVSRWDAGGLQFAVVDTAGGSRRMVAAMTSWQGATWFFKLSGNDRAVAQAKPDFLAFLRTVRTP